MKRILRVLVLAAMVGTSFAVMQDTLVHAETIVHLERTAGNNRSEHPLPAKKVQQPDPEAATAAATATATESTAAAETAAKTAAETKVPDKTAAETAEDGHSVTASEKDKNRTADTALSKSENKKEIVEEEPIITSKNRRDSNTMPLSYSDHKKIAIILAGDNEILAEAKITTEIDKVLAQKFPAQYYDLVKDKKVYTKLLEYAEDRDVTQLDALKKADFITVGTKFGYDYLIVLPFYYSGGNSSTTGWTNILQQNVTLRARIVDVRGNEYLYRMDVVKQGESGNAFGSPSNVRATREAIHRCLIEVLSDIDIGQKMSIE